MKECVLCVVYVCVRKSEGENLRERKQKVQNLRSKEYQKCFTEMELVET